MDVDKTGSPGIGVGGLRDRERSGRLPGKEISDTPGGM